MKVPAWILGTLFTCCASFSGFARSADATARDAGAAPMQYLDLAHPSLNWTVGDRDANADRRGTSRGVPEASGDPSARFVRVDIADVLNPELRALVFDVAFQPDQGDEIDLGTFSLYPSDQPGHFIVPTQSHVKAGGSIVVKMTVLDPAKTDQRLRVCVGSVVLVFDFEEKR